MVSFDFIPAVQYMMYMQYMCNICSAIYDVFHIYLSLIITYHGKL